MGVNKEVGPPATFVFCVSKLLVAFFGISGQNLRSCGVDTGPGSISPSSTPNGRRGNELCPNSFLTTIKVTTINM